MRLGIDEMRILSGQGQREHGGDGSADVARYGRQIRRRRDDLELGEGMRGDEQRESGEQEQTELLEHDVSSRSKGVGAVSADGQLGREKASPSRGLPTGHVARGLQAKA